MRVPGHVFLFLHNKNMLWVHITHLAEALLMSLHNIVFVENCRKLSQNYHQVVLW